jgi:hypothetical protein
MEGKYFFFYSSISEPCVPSMVCVHSVSVVYARLFGRSIYGGIGMGIAAVALINLFALGNVRDCLNSYRSWPLT